MSVENVNRGFKGIWIPKEIWCSTELTLQEKLFLVEIESLDNDEGCYASNAYFADFFQLTKQRVSQIISALKDKQLITVEYKYKEGTKSIEKRTIRIDYDKLNEHLKLSSRIKKTLQGGIKYINITYQENFKDNNTSINNTDTISNDIVIDETEKSKNSQSKTTQLLANSLDDKISNNITTSSLIEKPKKKVNKKQENIMTMKGMINTFTDNDEVRARLLDYFDIRLKRGLQPIQWKIILDDLRRAAKDNASQAISLINAATAGGWLKIVYSDDNKSKAKFDNTAGRKVDAVVNMSQAEQENYRNNLAKDEFGNLMMF